MAYDDSGDLFGGNTKYQVKSKWNISDFMSSGYNKTKPRSSFMDGGSSASASDTMEMDRIYKSIETEVAKLKLDYDKIYREMDFKRKEIKQDMEQLRVSGAKGQDISLMHNADISIMTNQARIVDSKRMLLNDKFKSIRDEKKLFMDKLKAEGKLIPDKTDINVVQANSSSPLAAATMARQTQFTPASVGASQLSGNLQIENTTVQGVSPTPVIVNESTTTTPTPIVYEDPNRDKVLRTDLMGNEITLGTQIDKNATLLQERLAMSPEDALNVETMIGFNLKTSLNSMILKGVPLQKIMYVNVEDGTYDVKAYRQDENGEFTVRDYDWHELSIIHCGRLGFDYRKKEVKLQFEDDAIPYVLEHESNDRSKFYVEEWADMKTREYVLPDEVIQRLTS